MNLIIRPFKDSAADAVFRIRERAFVTIFCNELSPEQVPAGVTAYLPGDYQRLAGELQIFVVADTVDVVAFFALQRHDLETAELVYIYIDPKNHHHGIGSYLMRYAEEWVRANWPEVRQYFLDTIIPRYNGGFYRKMGFSEAGPSQCIYPDLAVPARRFSKVL